MHWLLHASHLHVKRDGRQAFHLQSAGRHCLVGVSVQVNTIGAVLSRYLTLQSSRAALLSASCAYAAGARAHADRAVHGAGEEMEAGASQPELPKDAGEASIAHLDKLRYSKGSLSTAQIRGNMQRVMQVPPCQHD